MQCKFTAFILIMQSFIIKNLIGNNKKLLKALTLRRKIFEEKIL